MSAPGTNTYQKWEAQGEGELERKLGIMRSKSQQGLNLDQIAKAVGISKRTLIEMKKRHKSVYHAIEMGREVVTAMAQGALVKKIQAGDTASIIYALKIYGGMFFRQDRVVVEISGPDGGPIEHKEVVDVSKFTTEQLDGVVKILSPDPNPKSK